MINSCLEIYSRNDFLVNWKEKAPKHFFKENQFLYNQKLVSKMSCTATSWLTAFTNNFGIIACEEIELQAIWDDCKLTWWATEEEWGWIHKATDRVRRYYRNLGYDVETRRVENLSDDFFFFLDLGYIIHTWIIAWGSLYKDMQDDWDIDLIEHDWTTYWHSICIMKEWNDYYLLDNYKWDHTFNKILVTREWLRWWELFAQGYVYINFWLTVEKLKETLKWASIFKKARILAWVIRDYGKDSKSYRKLLEVFK